MSDDITCHPLYQEESLTEKVSFLKIEIEEKDEKIEELRNDIDIFIEFIRQKDLFEAYEEWYKEWSGGDSLYV